MKLNMLVLAISSVLQLVFILWHLFKYRKKTVAISFIVFGLIFGIMRSSIINFIQVATNDSILPYQLKNSILQIGNDSLQVYVGWIIAAYYAWCFAEIILKKMNKVFNKNNLENNIFAVLSVSFVFIASFSYMVETTASFMGWWDWNSSLVAGFSSSLFFNVPWVGIIDWATVAFEMLGIFMVSRYVYKTGKLQYILIVLFPIAHWISHVNFGNFYWIIFGQIITISTIVHLLIPVFAALVFFLNAPFSTKENMSYRLVWTALLIGVAVCLLSDIAVGKSVPGLISLIPISILLLIAVGVSIINLFYVGFLVVLAGLLFLPDLLSKKRLTMAFFPLVYFAFIYLIGFVPKIITKLANYQKAVIAIAIVASVTALGLSGIKFVSSAPQDNVQTVSGLSTKISKDKKYMLLITIDTLRNDHTGVGGYERDITPNLDRLAKNGIYFSNAYSPIPLTYPAHMSLMTGLYPKSLSIDYNSLSTSTNQPTLAESFSDTGYNTAAFISTRRLEKDSVKKGFNVFNYQSDNSVSYLKGITQRKADNTNKQVFSWLDGNYKNPFFLWVHYYDSHSPYDTYCQKSFSIGKSPDHKEFIKGDVSVASPKPTQKDYDFLIARYDEEVACQDQQLGKLIDYLKKIGIYDDTNIIVVSDHGENFEHNSVFHGLNLYQDAIRVPMVVKLRGFADNNSENQVLLNDIYPTLIQYFGLKNNAKSDALSLQSNNIINRKDIFFQTTSKLTNGTTISKAAVIQDKYNKLIADTLNKTMTDFESYSLNVDAGELNNIYNPLTTTQVGTQAALSSFLND